MDPGSGRPRVTLSAPDIGDEERRLVDEVMAGSTLSNGSVLRAFEEEFAERIGVPHAVAVSSGTAALHLSVIAAGVTESDIVLTSPFSFIASANAALYERATPVFVDICAESLALDPTETERAVESFAARHPERARWLPRRGAHPDATLRAVLPVHVFGRPAGIENVAAAARRHGVAVIEDACEALGAFSGKAAIGSLGDAAAFGFYPNKQITTGEGGMLVTPHAAWAATLRSLRNQGRDEGDTWLRHSRLGYNYRLDELSAALGLAQLRRLDVLLERRRVVASWYAEALAETPGVALLPPVRDGDRMSWFVYVVRLAAEVDRARVMGALEGDGIPTRAYFPTIHLQPFYRERFGYQPGDFPKAEEAARRLLTLPFHTALSRSDVAFVSERLARRVADARSPSRRTGTDA